LGVGTSTVHGWRQDNRNPSSELIVPICDFFGITTNYLLTGKKSDETFPEILKGDGLSAHLGGEDWTQAEREKLAEFALFIKSQRPKE
jgi:transcriptional regulator with XRE-family HTH domain